MPSNTYTLIASSTVGAGGTATITFNNIPQTYTDLKLLCSVRNDRTNGTAGYLNLLFNNSSSSFTKVDLYGISSSTGSSFGTGTLLSYFVGTDLQTSNTFGSLEYYIPNYTGSTNKSFSHDGTNENNSAAAESIYQGFIAGLWSNTAAITRIDINATPGSAATVFKQYSTFYLYGIKNS